VWEVASFLYLCFCFRCFRCFGGLWDRCGICVEFGCGIEVMGWVDRWSYGCDVCARAPRAPPRQKRRRQNELIEKGEMETRWR
jgi:hypothetical protein